MQASCSSSCASCHGVPTGCTLQVDETSCAAAGCTWSGTCGGIEIGCYGILGSLACTEQMGCYYDYTTSTCTGVAEACSLIPDEFTCGDQMGCSWQSGCSGVSLLSCDSLSDETSCLQAGCLWD